MKRCTNPDLMFFRQEWHVTRYLSNGEAIERTTKTAPGGELAAFSALNTDKSLSLVHVRRAQLTFFEHGPDLAELTLAPDPLAGTMFARNMTSVNDCARAYRFGEYAELDTHPCPHDAEPARFCSQCGHDAQPDAPQPTDTGMSYDVPANCPICEQRYAKRWDHDRTCATTWSTPETLHGHTSAETAYVVDDYPYGARLRCQIRYWIETTKHGQRFVSQTCNPKTGRWNNPKKTTYSEVMVMIQDSRGHVSYTALGSWPTECEMQRMEMLLGDNISDDQRKTIAQWRIMNKAQKHVTYEVVATPRAYSLNDPDDLAELREWNAEHPAQTQEEVQAVWDTAIARAMQEA